MSQTAFVSAIQKITAGGMSFHDLIAAAQGLSQGGEIDLARQLYAVWSNFNREHPLLFVAHFNASTLHTQLGDEKAAIESLKAALALNPDFSPAHINLGSALERQGGAGAAVDQWRAGLDRMTAITGDAINYKATLLKQISRVSTDSQQHEPAEAALIQCLDLNPDQRDVIEQFAAVRLAQCKWPIAAASPKLTRRDFVSRFHPLSGCAYADDPLLQLALANRYVKSLTPPESVSLASDRRHAGIDLSGRRLRIGYVSSDLRHHAVGYLMAQLFETHDRDAVEVFAYYCGPAADDSISRRITGAVEHFTNIRGMSDDAAAAKIAADGIDILVDVNGHTREARIGLFARRPAPVIVNWLGYPGTMGSPFHHYIIGDERTIPPGDEIYFSEAVRRLPCYQPNDRNRQIAEIGQTREQAGLPEGKFVFCSFNAAHKVTRYSFERWLEILRRTPDSVMWLLDYGQSTNARLRSQAERAGIDPARFVFAPKIANPHHLARYPLADLFLDTSPYGAHTTASDALWMGVPVLTMTGRCFAAKVCSSLVTAAGLGDMVCDGPDAFVARAVSLATGDRSVLADLRQRLLANRDTSTLFDIVGLTRSLEALFHDMAYAHQRGQTPQPRLEGLDAYLEIGAAFDHDAREIGVMEDYHGIYRSGLAALHRHRPLTPDGRLWREEDVAALERAAAPAPVRDGRKSKAA